MLEVLRPQDAAAEFEGTIDHQGVPPGDLVAAVQLGGAYEIGVVRAVKGPAREIDDHFFCFFARQMNFSRSGTKELRQHLGTDCTAIFLNESFYEFDGASLLPDRPVIHRVDKDIGIDKLR